MYDNDKAPADRPVVELVFYPDTKSDKPPPGAPTWPDCAFQGQLTYAGSPKAREAALSILAMDVMDAALVEAARHRPVDSNGPLGQPRQESYGPHFVSIAELVQWQTPAQPRVPDPPGAVRAGYPWLRGR